MDAFFPQVLGWGENSAKSVHSSFLSPCYGNYSILIEKCMENGLVCILGIRATMC